MENLKNIYYVYELIEPRDNQVFYIGKGKNKRYRDHLDERPDFSTNTEKLKLIQELKDTLLDVKVNIIAEGLSEETAYMLERLLIHRIGRKIFNEGPLLNITPGGIWTPASPYFINESDLPTRKQLIDVKKIDEILDKYPYTKRKEVFENDLGRSYDYLFYIYDRSGEKIKTMVFNELKITYRLGGASNIVKYFKGTLSPVYAKRTMVSIINYNKLPSIENIPFEDLDEINIKSVSAINNTISSKRTEKYVSFYSNGNLLFEINITKGELNGKFIYYFENGSVKHISNHSSNLLDGDKCIYDETGKKVLYEKYNRGCIKNRTNYFLNGQIKNETIYMDNTKSPSEFILSKQYYSNGQLKNITDEEKNFKSFYENGILLGEGNYLNGISKTYYENGSLMHLVERLNGKNVGKHFEYYPDGNIKVINDYSDNDFFRIETHYNRFGEETKINKIK